MAMVTVYSFKGYSAFKDKNLQAPRKAIQMFKGVPIEDTAEEVDEARLDGDRFLRDDM